MTWKLLHLLFGWDYIHWRNSADTGIARVHVDGNGRPYYWRYKNIAVLDGINAAKDVRWLTCSSSKYLSTDEGAKK